MRTTRWTSGEWNALCDVCGFKFKASDLKLRWDGLWCDDPCWEVRHPADFLRPIKDEVGLPWSRPDPGDTFINSCFVWGLNGVAGVGTAGCAVAGKDNGYRQDPNNQFIG